MSTHPKIEYLLINFNYQRLLSRYFLQVKIFCQRVITSKNTKSLFYNVS